MTDPLGAAPVERAERLVGWRVVITRPAHQSADLAGALEASGASAIELPTIAIAPPSDGGKALGDAATRLDEFDWVVFTSENAVERLFRELGDARSFGHARVAAIGGGTAEALSRHGVTADLVPQRFIAEALVEAFPLAERDGRVLLPRAEVARDVVPEGLRRLGWQVEVVPTYRTVPAEPTPAALTAAREADAITFTSSSTVTGYLAFQGPDDLPPVVASIGPITSGTAKSAGMRVDVEADIHSVDGLVEALAAFASRHGRPPR